MDTTNVQFGEWMSFIRLTYRSRTWLIDYYTTKAHTSTNDISQIWETRSNCATYRQLKWLENVSSGPNFLQETQLITTSFRWLVWSQNLLVCSLKSLREILSCYLFTLVGRGLINWSVSGTSWSSFMLFTFLIKEIPIKFGRLEKRLESFNIRRKRLTLLSMERNWSIYIWGTYSGGKENNFS